jgi:hypothetical protein
MSKPITKEELATASATNFQRLKLCIASLPPESREKEFPSGSLNRSISDVLCHLYHWQLMFMDWYTIGQKGEKADMPAKGYTWKTLPLLNQKIQKEYRNFEVQEAWEMLEISHDKFQAIITSHSDEELFTKKKYLWTGSTSLGAYLISATASHYDWAFKVIKRQTKNYTGTKN